MMVPARGAILVTLVRVVAPLWMVATGFVAALAGVMVYFAGAAVVRSFPIDVPEGIVIPLYTLFVASPILIALVLCGRVSAVLYRQDAVAAPALFLHLWHCAFLYPLAGWTLFLVVTCPRTPPPVSEYCADPLGTSMAAGVVALGGIVADAFAASRRRRSFIARSDQRTLT